MSLLSKTLLNTTLLILSDQWFQLLDLGNFVKKCFAFFLRENSAVFKHFFLQININAIQSLFQITLTNKII